MNAVAFAGENDAVLVSAGFDRTVRFFDCRSGRADAIQTLGGVGHGRKDSGHGFKDAVSSVAVSDTKILAGSVDGSARTFDVRGGVGFWTISGRIGRWSPSPSRATGTAL